MILSAAFLALMLTGCGKKKETAGNTAETGVPPSLALAEAKGPVLVTLTPQQIAELKIPLQTISSEVRNFEVHAPGTVYPAPNFIGIVSAPVEGRIVSMNVQEGQAVKKGSVIIEIESLVYGNLVADYLQASAEVDLQSNQLQRMEKLTEKRISAEMDLEKTKADHARALASLNACYAKLKTLGVSDPDIDALKGSQKINPRLKIHSPISGVVDSHRVELGQAVGVNDELATVVCLDKVLVKSYLAPEDGQEYQPSTPVSTRITVQ
jgi:cobalt-zinc-cadmium efflux system membrane fusion protein